MFFPGFTLEHVPVPGGGTIRLRRGGSGPPLLMLHGNPQTHAMWHAVAPALARRFTVVCPDLRGYGGSLKPDATADHAPYAKRAMAQDFVEVMQKLATSGSWWQATTAARGWRTGWPSTIPSGCSEWPCSTSCRPSNISSAPTCALRSATTIGSGSPSRIPSPRC